MKRIVDIAHELVLNPCAVKYRINELGIIPINRWYYDSYQIELIKNFERTPRTKYIIVESKINNHAK